MLSSFSHVIVDEVHERSVDSDFLIVHLKRIVAAKRSPPLKVCCVDGTGPRCLWLLGKRPAACPLRPKPCRKLTSPGTSKVVLMSATVNAQIWSKYLGDAPIVQAQGRAFPVQTFGLDAALLLTDYALEADSEVRGLAAAPRLGAREADADVAAVCEQGQRELADGASPDARQGRRAGPDDGGVGLAPRLGGADRRAGSELTTEQLRRGPGSDADGRLARQRGPHRVRIGAGHAPGPAQALRGCSGPGLCRGAASRRRRARVPARPRGHHASAGAPPRPPRVRQPPPLRGRRAALLPHLFPQGEAPAASVGGSGKR
jgi:hypothetical protein